MQLPNDILAQIKHIEFQTKKMMSETLLGRYRSLFKGQGLEFSDHRVYLPGDDVRHIDWKASARSKEPLMKRYVEERQLQVFLVVDISRSSYFGTKSSFKIEVSALVASLLTLAAQRTGDRTGLILFTDEVEHIVAPSKGVIHSQRLIRDIISHQPRTQGTSLQKALTRAHQVMNHRGVIFVISDFQDQGYEGIFRTLAQKHDMVAIIPQDPAEQKLPNLGHVRFVDGESLKTVWMNTSQQGFQALFEQQRQVANQQLNQLLARSRVDRLDILTTDDATKALVKYFQTKKRQN